MMGWDNYEPEVVRPWFALASEAKVVLDVGAHVGLFALLASHANPSSQVWAFEPLPDTFSLLQRNASLNEGTLIQCVEAAVGDREGKVRLYVDPAQRYDIQASLTAREGQSKSLAVSQVSLDRWLLNTTYLRSISSRSMLKVQSLRCSLACPTCSGGTALTWWWRS
jgi:FkbM family methyltransferase